MLFVLNTSPFTSIRLQWLLYPLYPRLVLSTIKQHSLLVKYAAADKRYTEQFLGKDCPDNSQVSNNGVFMSLVSWVDIS